MDLLAHLPAPTWLWAGLCIALPMLLALDLWTPPPTPKQAGLKTLMLTLLALGFGGALAIWGPEKSGYNDAVAFWTAYVVELSLSVDNLFVFLLLFQSFRVPKPAIGRVLSAGIIGALVLRAVFIGSGLWLVERFSWLFYLFGAILVGSGLKLLVPEREPAEGEDHTPRIAKWCQKLLPMASAEDERGAPSAFLVRAARTGRLACTRLSLVLVAIEASDIVFALDSVPAGFAITQKGWLLFAANALAILGLRALFVALDDSLRALRFLRPALALVLLFIGGKMLVGHFVEVPMMASLAVIVGILAVAVGLSLWMPTSSSKKLP